MSFDKTNYLAYSSCITESIILGGMQTITNKTVNNPISNSTGLKEQKRYFKLEFTQRLTISQISGILETLKKFNRRLKFHVECL